MAPEYSHPIDVELLRKLIACDPETGALTWLPRPREMFPDENSWRGFQSSVVGASALISRCHGYRYGKLLGRKYYAHRVVWALCNGEWPPEQVDHINGDRSDNRIRNLRAVSKNENCRNICIPKTNTSGVLGVRWSKAAGKWCARLKTGGKDVHLGLFDTIEAAAQARAAANERYGFHVNHGRPS